MTEDETRKLGIAGGDQGHNEKQTVSLPGSRALKAGSFRSENDGGDCFRISVYDGEGFSEKDERIIREIPLAVHLNDRKIITIACAGLHVEELAVGFLRSEGFLRIREDVAAVEVSPDRTQVRIRTAAGREIPDPETTAGRTLASSGARGFGGPAAESPEEPLSGRFTVAPEAVLDLMERFLGQARLHEETGGTHAAALARNGEILVVREDIGRHNTIDMLGGYALLHGVDCRDAVIFRTGRVSSEIVHKIWRLGVPWVCSLSVPTTQAVEIARAAGITLIGSVRRGRMKIYS
ncbi:MAG: formate dehydrogenase accessory sulfurtransferase FdhD [Deltaproteobacteria bacterium]|nr:formate dehydrogenase accessory sulfurtransferase FdhD [Deltaproteobacteria bacterium]